MDGESVSEGGVQGREDSADREARVPRRIRSGKGIEIG